MRIAAAVDDRDIHVLRCMVEALGNGFNEYGIAEPNAMSMFESLPLISFAGSKGALLSIQAKLAGLGLLYEMHAFSGVPGYALLPRAKAFVHFAKARGE